MSETSIPSLSEVERALGEAAVGVDAAELHGSMCGLLCAGGHLAGANWLEALAIDGPRMSPGSVLDRLRVGTHAQLADTDYGFELLLPEEGEDLGARIEALCGWCRGFLGGYGLGQGGDIALSEEAQEALADLARIAQSDLSFEEGDDDESALAEIIEFVRVAALLLHSEGSVGPSGGTLH